MGPRSGPCLSQVAHGRIIVHIGGPWIEITRQGLPSIGMRTVGTDIKGSRIGVILGYHPDKSPVGILHFCTSHHDELKPIPCAGAFRPFHLGRFVPRSQVAVIGVAGVYKIAIMDARAPLVSARFRPCLCPRVVRNKKQQDEQCPTGWPRIPALNAGRRTRHRPVCPPDRGIATHLPYAPV